MEWISLKEIEELKEIEQESNSHPVLIFKHSTRCSISSMMLGKLERNWDGQALNQPVKTYKLDLIAYREISNEIEQKWGVSHQSPQVIVLLGGKPAFDASHMGIAFDSIKKVINQ